MDNSVDKAFLDRGDWQFNCGEHNATVDGYAFFEEAEYLYEGHDRFDEIPISGESDSATLLVPRDIVLDWKRRLEALPPTSGILRTLPKVHGAL